MYRYQDRLGLEGLLRQRSVGSMIREVEGVMIEVRLNVYPISEHEALLDTKHLSSGVPIGISPVSVPSF